MEIDLVFIWYSFSQLFICMPLFIALICPTLFISLSLYHYYFRRISYVTFFSLIFVYEYTLPLSTNFSFTTMYRTRTEERESIDLVHTRVLTLVLFYHDS